MTEILSTGIYDIEECTDNDYFSVWWKYWVQVFLTVMLEGGANNVDYELFKEAIKIGHAESFRIINSIQNLATEVKTFKHQSQPPASQDNFRELRDTVYR